MDSSYIAIRDVVYLTEDEKNVLCFAINNFGGNGPFVTNDHMYTTVAYGKKCALKAIKSGKITPRAIDILNVVLAKIEPYA